MSSRTSKLALGAVILATLTAACFDGNACQAIHPSPLPSPSPSPSSSPSPLAVAGCDPVYSVGVSVEGHPNPLRVGETYVLDATPKGPGGEKLDPICHGSTVTWVVTGPCAINGGGFNPRLICGAPGTMTATATVSAPGGTGSVTLQVVA